MSSPIISLPAETPWWFPNCLEHIIDKKVNRVALNCIERLIDYLFTRFYGTYSDIFTAKLNRISIFSSNVRFYDATSNGIARITDDAILLNGRKVFFDPDFRNMIFSSQTTDYILALDAEERGPAWVQIIEYRTPRPENPNPLPKTWMVDTLKVVGVEVYLVES